MKRGIADTLTYTLPHTSSPSPLALYKPWRLSGGGARAPQVPLEALKVARSAASDRVETVCQAAAAVLEALATHCAGALWAGGGAGWEMAVTAAVHGTQVREHTHTHTHSPYSPTLISIFIHRPSNARLV